MIYCDCAREGWCPHYRIELRHRLWEIAKGIDISEDLRQKYLVLWESQVPSLPETPPPLPPPPKEKKFVKTKNGLREVEVPKPCKCGEKKKKK